MAWFLYQRMVDDRVATLRMWQPPLRKAWMARSPPAA
jgi:hypothetical protein